MRPMALPPLTFSERQWRELILALSGAVIIVTLWCLMNGITTIFMHLYYFPIVLLAYRYRWKGCALAMLLALVYLGLVLIFNAGQPDLITGAFYRFLVFVGIAAVIAYLSDCLATTRTSLQQFAEIRDRYLSLAPAIILVLDRDGVITFLNPKGGSILECLPDEVVGRSWADVFVPERERQRAKQVLSQMMAGLVEQNRIFDMPVLTRPGAEKIIRWYNTVMHDEDGVTNGILGFGEDITAEKWAQDSLWKMQQFQENIIANANVWIMVLEPDGTPLVWNDAAEVISGYKRSGILGKKTVWKQLYPDTEYRKKVTGEIRQIIGRDTFLENFETEIRCADGTRKSIVWNTRGLRDDDGTITSYITIGHDITAQKSAESRALESSRFLASMINTLPTPVFFKDAEGRYLGCNPPFEEYIGISLKDLVGKTAYDLSPKNLADRYTEADQQVFANPVPQHYETQVQYADGSRHDVIFYKAAFLNTDGSVGGLIGTFLDITKRKTVEDALQKSEEKYRAFFTTSRDCIFITTVDGRWEDFNDAALELFGYESREELMKTSISAIYANPLDRDAHILFIQKNGYSFEYPVDLRKKDGTLIHTLITTVTRKDASGNTIGFQGSVRDITRHKRIEEQLTVSSMQLATALDLARIVNWEYDVGTDMFTFDDRFYAFYGTTAQREGGYRMSAETYTREFVYPEDISGVAGAIQEILGATDPLYRGQMEHRIIRRDGEVRTILARFAPVMDAQGNVIRTFGANQDITERKVAEEAMRESKSLVDAVVENVPLMIFLKEARDLRFVLFNRAGEELLGYDRKALLGKNNLDLFPPEQAAQFMEKDREVLDGEAGMLDIPEEPIQTARKGLRLLHTRKVCIRRDDGTTKFLLGISEDITERKRAEDERAKAHLWQEGVNRILESILSPVPLNEKLKIVTDGVIETFGADFCRIWLIDGGDRCTTGCMHASVETGPHACLYHDKCLHLKASSGRYTHLDGKAHRRVPFGAYKIGRIASGDEPKFLTNDVEHDPRIHDPAWAKDLGLVAFSGYRLKPPHGDVLGVFALFARFPITPQMDAILEGLSGAISLAVQKDLTDRALQESETQLNAVSEISRVGGWELDIRTNKVRWTRETYRIHEVPEGDTFEVANAINFYDLPGRSRMIDAIQRCTERGESFDLELPFTSAGGKHLWARAIGHAVKSGGTIIRLTGTFQDITGRKQAEDRMMLEKQRIESLLSLSQMSQSAYSEIISTVVEDAIRLTGSKIGYLATLNENESVMTMQYWSKSAHSSCNLIDKPLVYPVEKTGLWGEAIRQHKPVITNDYAAENPFKRGIPEGHVHLVRHMNIPVFDGDHIVAVAGVGNKESDYNDSDIRQLQLLMQGWWQIVARKRAEEAIRSREEQFRIIFHNQQTGLMMIDAGTHMIADVNMAALKMIGASREEVIGKVCHTFICSSEAGNCPVMDLGLAVENSERFLLRANGKTIPILISANPVTINERPFLIESFIDLSERKQMEQQLRESQQLFADIISFLPDPTFVIDRDGHVLAWNRALEQLSGIAAADIIGKGDYEYSLWQCGKRRPLLIDLVLHPDQDAGRMNYTSIHSIGQTVVAQVEMKEPGSGRRITLSLVASPLIDVQGNITGAIESLRDISSLKEAEDELARINQNLETLVKDRTRLLEEEIAQRKRAENDVRAALDYTRSVIEANPDLIVVLDDMGTIQDVNVQGELLTGISKDLLIGTPYFSYLFDDGTLQDKLAVLLQTGRLENFIQIRNTSGHITPLSVHATVIRGSEGTKDRIIVAAHDITRQKEDERSIKASLDEKVLLLREVHHRVKNNLQIIISLVNLQMRQTEDPSVKQIMSETQNRVRAMSLVHEKLYRSESLSRIDFADYTRFLATQLFSFYGTDSRRVLLDFAMGEIMVDINTAVPLGLLMNELISNALKHAFPDGREGVISIHGGDTGSLITLIVQDNGIGMPADLDWKNTTSLGMRLVSSLIDQVDGTVTLDRTPGTTFTITLRKKPLEKTPPAMVPD
ncbi:MAG: PAS domain S-box protein [Methanomicrobiales archaeon]